MTGVNTDSSSQCRASHRTATQLRQSPGEHAGPGREWRHWRQRERGTSQASRAAPRAVSLGIKCGTFSVGRVRGPATVTAAWSGQWCRRGRETLTRSDTRVTTRPPASLSLSLSLSRPDPEDEMQSELRETDAPHCCNFMNHVGN